MSEASAGAGDLRVGDVAAATGASVRMVRHYESSGLLVARRSAAGQRLFGADAVARVGHIRSLLRAGLPVSVIRELIDCIDDPGRLEPCAVPTLVAHLEQHDARLAAMLSTRTALQGLIDEADA